MGAATLKVRLMWDGNGLKADPMLWPLERIESWDTGKLSKCKDMGDCLGQCVLQKCACFNENCIPLLRNNLYLYGTFNGSKKLHNISQVTQDFFCKSGCLCKAKTIPHTKYLTTSNGQTISSVMFGWIIISGQHTRATPLHHETAHRNYYKEFVIFQRSTSTGKLNKYGFYVISSLQILPRLLANHKYRV